jgi:hypothetical protein
MNRAFSKNPPRVLSTVIFASLVAFVGSAKDTKSAVADAPAEQAEEPVEMVVGSPPMVSDDTGTPGNRNWEINLVFDGDISKHSKSFELPLLDINHGIGDRLQLKYEVPYAVARQTEFDENGKRTTKKASGVASSIAGVKYRFYDNEQSGLSLAVYPQIEFRTPGSKLKGEPDEGGEGGVAEEGVTFELPILLTKEFKGAAITANLRAEKELGDDHVSITASFGVGTRLTDKLAVMGEIAGHNLNRADEEHILLSLGFRLKISGKQAIMGSAGHDIQTGDGQKHFYVTLAYQRFFQHKKP